MNRRLSSLQKKMGRLSSPSLKVKESSITSPKINDELPPVPSTPPTASEQDSQPKVASISCSSGSDHSIASLKAEEQTVKNEAWSSNRIDFASECTFPCHHEETEQQEIVSSVSSPTLITTESPSDISKSSITPQKPLQDSFSKSQPNSWSRCSGEVFRVRCGPNYKKNKYKFPSEESLYQIAAVRCYKSNTIMPCVSQAMPFPQSCLITDNHPKGENGDDCAVSGRGDRLWKQEGNENVPEVLVVRFLVPVEGPSFFGGSKNKNALDCKSNEIVLYLRPASRFIAEMNKTCSLSSKEQIQDNVRPATRLFKKWCNLSTEDAAFRSRFKCIASIRDFETRHSNLSYLNRYNGKPVLITESGRAMRGTTCDGVRFLEFKCNLHFWSIVARTGLSKIMPQFADMRIDLGFTIEGVEEEELPECMMGNVCLNKIDEKLFRVIPSAVQQPLDGVCKID